MNAFSDVNDAQESGRDSFSKILSLLRVDVDVYHNAKVCGDWRLSEHQLGLTCFHMVTMNSCMLDVPEHLHCALHCGDLVIFPRELAHSMVAEKKLTGPQQHLDYRVSQTIEGTGMLCGAMRFQHIGSRFLLDALPPVFVIRYDESNGWMKPLLEMILSESMSICPASKALVNKLSELLFIYALRQYLSDNPKEVGMLAVYGHPRLARAVSAIHQQPEYEWTLDSMAKEAALSRTTFAETFKQVCGWTPGQYLTWWRMQLAWSLLVDGEASAEVANKVGYKSESAFSRIFKKTFLIAAGKVRRGDA